jgi:hypothetical protein
VERIKAKVKQVVGGATPQVTGAVTQISATSKKSLERAKPYRRQVTVGLSGSAALLLPIVSSRRRGLASGS